MADVRQGEENVGGHIRRGVRSPGKFWLFVLTGLFLSVRERLKDVLRQYELRERHFECLIRSKELEVLLSRARAAESKELLEVERNRAEKLEEEVGISPLPWLSLFSCLALFLLNLSFFTLPPVFFTSSGQHLTLTTRRSSNSRRKWKMCRVTRTSSLISFWPAVKKSVQFLPSLPPRQPSQWSLAHLGRS